MSFLIRELKRSLRYFLARFHRRRLNQVTFIGITGSAGKTTTTDLAAAILADSGPCKQTRGYNTLPAISKSLLQTNRRHRYCIAEFGIFGPRTLDRPVGLFKPDIAVVTLIGRDHYSAFKSMEGIAAEKEKVVLALPPDGTAVLNIDDPLVRSIGERCNRRVIWFGEGAGATLRLLEARSRWPEPLTLFLGYKDATYEVRTQLHGTHTAIPILAALGIALAAEIPIEQAIKAIAEVKSPEGRMQLVTADDGVVFIRDDFKAPYWSINAPFEFLKEATAERKVAVIGMISDSSGDYTPTYKTIARLLLEIADLIIFVGPHANRVRRGHQTKLTDKIKVFLNIENAAKFLNHELKKGDLVLLKGTNEQDHLVRLILNRRHPIHCWDSQCESQAYCDTCSRLKKPPPDADITDRDTPPSSGPSLPVIVGLGNPVLGFRRTPHNVGYRVLDNLAQSGNGIWRRHPDGSVCTLDLNSITVQLLKPGTAMNNSGAMVRRFLARNGCSPQKCIIVHDDMNFALGNVRLKSQGGDAGHKGMRSVLSALDTEEIPRVRLGVGRPTDTREAKKFVLTKFSAGEEKQIGPAIEQAAALVREYAQKNWGDKLSK